MPGACARKTPAPEVVRPVKVATAAGAGLIDKDFAGMATPDDAVNLAFKVAGQVLDVPVSQGAGVKKGELLAELDPRDIELQVAATRSAFEETRSQQQRMQRLLEHEAVSRQEAGKAAATRYAQARSTYENHLGLPARPSLKAPFAGVVERKYVDNFERVQAGQSIVRLVNPVTTKVQFTMPESGPSLLRTVALHRRFEPGRGHSPERVCQVSAALKDSRQDIVRCFGVPRVADPRKPRSGPLPHLAWHVVHDHHVERRSRSRCRRCPSRRHAPAEGGTYVLVVGGGDRVERRAVTLGELSGRDRVVVDSGVESGERVVTAGFTSCARANG